MAARRSCTCLARARVGCRSPAWSASSRAAGGRLFYRLRGHRGRKGERRSLSEDDYATLVTAAHNQLHAPIVLVWDNVNTHVSAAMRAFIDAHGQWLSVVQLPAYARIRNRGSAARRPPAPRRSEEIANNDRRHQRKQSKQHEFRPDRDNPAKPLFNATDDQRPHSTRKE